MRLTRFPTESRPDATCRRNARRIRILIATQYLNEGGVGRQIQYLVNRIDTSRFEVHLAVFCRQNFFFTDLLEGGRAELHFLGQGPLIGWRTVSNLVKLCRSLKPDVLHLYGGKANHIAGLASLLFAAPPLLFSVRSANNRRVNHLLYRLLRRRQALTVVNSEGIRRELVERSGYRREEVLVLHNFVDVRSFRPLGPSARTVARASLGLDDAMTTLACVGRLSKQKNQAATVRALAYLKRCGRLPRGLRFLFVGRAYEARYARRVHHLVRALGLESTCTFVEPMVDIARLYHAVDGIFQPALYEGLSNAVIEAQACGTPVALSIQGDNDSLVRHGETGISFQTLSVTGVAEGLERLVALCGDERRRATVTRQARTAVVERFGTALDVTAMEALYRRLASGSLLTPEDGRLTRDIRPDVQLGDS